MAQSRPRRPRVQTSVADPSRTFARPLRLSHRCRLSELARMPLASRWKRRAVVMQQDCCMRASSSLSSTHEPRPFVSCAIGRYQASVARRTRRARWADVVRAPCPNDHLAPVQPLPARTIETSLDAGASGPPPRGMAVAKQAPFSRSRANPHGLEDLVRTYHRSAECNWRRRA